MTSCPAVSQNPASRFSPAAPGGHPRPAVRPHQPTAAAAAAAAQGTFEQAIADYDAVEWNEKRAASGR